MLVVGTTVYSMMKLQNERRRPAHLRNRQRLEILALDVDRVGVVARPRPHIRLYRTNMLAAPVPWGVAEREQLAESGFVVLPRTITAAGLCVLNTAVDEHLAMGAPPMVTAPWLFPCAVGDALWRLANEPSIVDLARQLCGPNVLLWAGGLVLKMPQDDGGSLQDLIPWHQE